MGLRSAFDLLLASHDPLAGFDPLIWQSLAAAARSSKHPWYEGAFSTVELDAEGQPHPRTRTVILRGADPSQRTIDFYTDARSDKIDQLRQRYVAWLFYASAAKIQLRLQGSARILNGEEADAAWKQTPLHGRSAYLSIRSPGDSVASPIPPTTDDRQVSQQESERGRVTFRIVRTSVHTADWLYLRREGHVRARLDFRDNDDTRATWLVP